MCHPFLLLREEKSQSNRNNMESRATADDASTNTMTLKSRISEAWTTIISAPNHPITVHMAVVLVFVTHGLMNALLLSGWNNSGGLNRCLYWNGDKTECSVDQSWVLNFMSLGQFHVCLLIAALATMSVGHILCEHRLGYLVGTIAVSYLSNGIFMLDRLNQPLALLQAFIFVGMLIALAVHTAIAVSDSTPQSPELDDIVDEKKTPKLVSVSTLVMGLLCVLSSFQVLEMTVYNVDGSGNLFRGDIVDASLFQNMTHAAAVHRMWVTLILGWTTILATPLQQKAVFVAHATALCVGHMVLTMTSQGQLTQPDQLRAACVGNFFTMLVAIMGLY